MQLLGQSWGTERRRYRESPHEAPEGGEGVTGKAETP